MTATIDHGKEEVAKLCRYFTINRQAFLAPGVKEAHIRQSLITSRYCGAIIALLPTCQPRALKRGSPNSTPRPRNAA
jgi:hypothetical protein